VQIDGEVFECDLGAETLACFLLDDRENAVVNALAVQNDIESTDGQHEENQQAGKEPADGPPCRMASLDGGLLPQLGFGLLFDAAHVKRPVLC
jgi:hypothetical protein